MKNEITVRNAEQKDVRQISEIIVEDWQKAYRGIIDDAFLDSLNIDERYEREAGISVGISLGNKVYIDAVGHGFDGREVLKGISCHERYSIPWSDLRRVSVDNFKEYRTYLIENEKYFDSRKERINYLESCGLEKDIIEENIPKEYHEIPDYIWLSIIRDIIKKLEEEEDLLRSAGFFEFNISGHTEGRYFAPWQMVDDKRM